MRAMKRRRSRSIRSGGEALARQFASATTRVSSRRRDMTRDAPFGQERHGLDAARSLERERGVVFAHDPHRTVQRAARHRVAGIRVRERDDADGRVVLQRAEQPASGRP